MKNYEMKEVDGVGWISSKPRWAREDTVFLTFAIVWTLGAIALILRFFGII
jgi:hypothetical protein